MNSEDLSELLIVASDVAHPKQATDRSSELKGLLAEIDSALRRVAELTNVSLAKSSVEYRAQDPTFDKWLQGEYFRRRQRDKFFPADALLGEPGWDLLLDLAIQRCANKPISITSACIAAQVPTTTALRWIGILEQLGLVERSVDEHDKRRSLVSISDLGLERLRRYHGAITQ